MTDPTTGQPAAPAAPAAPAPPAVPAAPAAPATPVPPAAGDPPQTDPATPGTDPDDKPLGPGGEKALAAEREARKELEKKVAALAPLQAIADALGVTTPAEAKTEIEVLAERQAQFEATVAQEREARWRAEVANEKGLSPDQAARLQGKSREELLADADAVITLFGITPGKGATPRPDPSQGARGAVDINAEIAAAEAAGDTRKAIALKSRQLLATKD